MRPLAVAMRRRKPCVLSRLRTFGCQVRFVDMIYSLLSCTNSSVRSDRSCILPYIVLPYTAETGDLFDAFDVFGTSHSPDALAMSGRAVRAMFAQPLLSAYSRANPKHFGAGLQARCHASVKATLYVSAFWPVKSIGRFRRFISGYHQRRCFVGVSSYLRLKTRQPKIVKGLAYSPIAWYYQC